MCGAAHASAGSDVVYFNVLGTPMLVINSYDTAHELLNKKGTLYSSRPRLTMLKELCVPLALCLLPR